MQNADRMVMVLSMSLFSFLFTWPSSGGERVAALSGAEGEGGSRGVPVANNMMEYSTGDLTIAEANRKARATLPRFFELADQGVKGSYLVKMALRHDGQTEHVWVEVSGYANDVFHGRLANDPAMGRGKAGDHVSLRREEVEDWMINTGEVRYGGYTIRAMLKDMPKARAQALKRQLRD